MRHARFTGWLAASVVACLVLVSEGSAEEAVRRAIGSTRPIDLENSLYMELACGRVVIEMLPGVAPMHVDRIKTLARQHFYDGIVFHRVVPGFMAQGGDPTGTGRGGSKLPDVPAEFSNVPFDRGIVGMARAADPNSANSQFFIMFDRWAYLDGQYTVWGRVVSGMDCVDQMATGEPPAHPTMILSLRIAADTH